MSPPLRKSRQPIMVFGSAKTPNWFKALWSSPAGKQNASPANPSGLSEALSAEASYGPLQVRKKGSPAVMKSIPNGVDRSDSDVHGVQCPISNCVLMLVCSAAQGTMFPTLAVE